VWRVPIPNRYTAKAKLCFCKNNKRRIIIHDHHAVGKACACDNWQTANDIARVSVYGVHVGLNFCTAGIGLAILRAEVRFLGKDATAEGSGVVQLHSGERGEAVACRTQNHALPQMQDALAHARPASGSRTVRPATRPHDGPAVGAQGWWRSCVCVYYCRTQYKAVRGLVAHRVRAPPGFGTKFLVKKRRREQGKTAFHSINKPTHEKQKAVCTADFQEDKAA
jgi:hypothetical protein